MFLTHARQSRCRPRSSGNSIRAGKTLDAEAFGPGGSARRPSLLSSTRLRPSDLEALFNVSPNPYVLMRPDFTIAGMNDAYLRVTMRERSDLMNRNMFEAFPSAPHDAGHGALQCCGVM